MKVGIISSYPPKESGIGTYSNYLVNELNSYCHISVLKWNYSGKFKAFFSPIFNFYKLYKFLKNNEVAHVQFHLGDQMFLFLPIISFLKLFTKCKIVLTLHEDYKNLFYFNIINFYLNFFYHFVDGLIIHVNSHKTILTKSLLKKTIYIPHGVIYRNISHLDDKEDIITLPGFINPWKGHHLAINALVKVIRNNPNVKLRIIGKPYDNKYYRELLDLIDTLNISNHVDIIDKYVSEEELFKYLKNTKIALIPYIRTTMSGILCHILSWNVPVIMSDLNEFKEFTKNKCLYFKTNDVDDLANKIIYLLNNSSKRIEISNNLSKLSKEYGWKNIAKTHFEFYKSLI